MSAPETGAMSAPEEGAVGAGPLAGRPVIIGAGLAGLTAALALAPHPVTVLAASPLGAGAATDWAQGGIAAALGPDDSVALHLADTLAAGDGLCDAAMAASILADAPAAIARLQGWGVRFDAAPDGTLRLGLEAAHARHRIVHADGDGTGHAVLAALVARVRATPSIRVIERARVRRLLQDSEGRIAGIAADLDGAVLVIPTGRVVIATGGIGGLFAETTNPRSATGSGLALAAAAGARFAELEFVQFHPTAIDAGRDPMPLASEALRGEGAILIDETGCRFMEDWAEARGRAELAPRDVVARAIASRLAAGHRVFLDARAALGDRFATRFPGVARLCREAGIDPATMPIPVRPAAHYAMGGIVTDAVGATSIEGLYACGEAAATGLHGANRLASNSLLEATIMGARVAAALAGTAEPHRRKPEAIPALAAPGAVDAIRAIMSRGFSVLRDSAGMAAAADALQALLGRAGVDQEALGVALMIAAAALARQESRGAHARQDFPVRDSIPQRRFTTLAEARAFLPGASADRAAARQA